MDADLCAALKLAIDNGDDIAAAALAALTDAESQLAALAETVRDVANTLEVAHLGRTEVDASDLSARLDSALSNLSAAGTQHDEAILAGPKGALTRVMAEHTELVERVAVVVGIMRQIKRNNIADFLESAIPSNFAAEHDERVHKETAALRAALLRETVRPFDPVHSPGMTDLMVAPEDIPDFATQGDAMKPEIVVLCGSTRFYDAFQQANYDLTMAGKIVLSVGFYPHTTAEHGHGEGIGHDSAQKITLDELHKRKIDLADRVLVLNVGGYIGDSTRNEIAYAEAHGKPVEYLETP